MATVFAITDKPRTQQSQLGGFIRAAPARATRMLNRFQPLSLRVWQEMAAEVKSTAANSLIVDSTQTIGEFPHFSCGSSAKTAPPAQRGQGEIGGDVHSSQAQTCSANMLCIPFISHVSVEGVLDKSVDGILDKVYITSFAETRSRLQTSTFVFYKRLGAEARDVDVD